MLLKEHIKHISLVIFCLLTLAAKADIGETYDLKQQRAALEFKLNSLMIDSLSTQEEIEAIYQQLLSIDKKIFSSYDQTVNRLTGLQTSDADNSKKLVWLALGTSLISIVFAILLAIGRMRLIENSKGGLFEVYKQLSLDFFSRVSPSKSGSGKMLRVNAVVVVGVLFMSVSIIAFLLTKL